MKAIEAASRLALAREFANQALGMLNGVPAHYLHRAQACDAREDLSASLAHLDSDIVRVQRLAEVQTAAETAAALRQAMP